MAETLVRVQQDGSIGPGLARRFSQSADGKSFTFELRQDVEFHDGTLLNAEAATLSLKRFLNPQLRVSLRAPFDASLIEGITPVDPLTFRITLKDTSKFEDVLTESLQEGANYVHGIEFRTTELRKHRDAVRALASNDPSHGKHGAPRHEAAASSPWRRRARLAAARAASRRGCRPSRAC